jgi:large conductance mechanosensitive channel
MSFTDDTKTNQPEQREGPTVFKEFKEFAMRGNVVDMATGIVIGGAFGAIVKSLVDEVLMPPIGLLLGGVDFSNFFLVLKDGKIPGPYDALAAAKTAGAVSVNYGVFFNAVVSFLIVAFAIFMVIKAMNTLRRQEAAPPAEPTTRDCPFCVTAIPIKATRCPHCTSEV